MHEIQMMDVSIPSGGVLEGILAMPAESRGVIAFAHGSGSSRQRLAPPHTAFGGARPSMLSMVE